MRERQRELGEQGDVVIEGRDIGTVVAPNAEVKVYLDADASVRAQPAPGRASRTSAATRSRPTCACATRATRCGCSRPKMRSGSTRPTRGRGRRRRASSSSCTNARRVAAMNRTADRPGDWAAALRRRRARSRRRCASTARTASRANGPLVLASTTSRGSTPLGDRRRRAADALLRREAGGARQSRSSGR